MEEVYGIHRVLARMPKLSYSSPFSNADVARANEWLADLRTHGEKVCEVTGRELLWLIGQGWEVDVENGLVWLAPDDEPLYGLTPKGWALVQEWRREAVG